MATVLVVDDTLFMCLTLKNLLEKGGFQVVGTARDGREAVEKYRELGPDYVTMDLVMPGKNGLEAIKEIMELDPGARIVVLSTMDQPGIVRMAIDAGARDYLMKPFQVWKITKSLQNIEAKKKIAIFNENKFQKNIQELVLRKIGNL